MAKFQRTWKISTLTDLLNRTYVNWPQQRVWLYANERDRNEWGRYHIAELTIGQFIELRRELEQDELNNAKPINKQRVMMNEKTAGEIRSSVKRNAKLQRRKVIKFNTMEADGQRKLE